MSGVRRYKHAIKRDNNDALRRALDLKVRGRRLGD